AGSPAAPTKVSHDAPEAGGFGSPRAAFTSGSSPYRARRAPQFPSLQSPNPQFPRWRASLTGRTSPTTPCCPAQAPRTSPTLRPTLHHPFRPPLRHDPPLGSHLRPRTTFSHPGQRCPTLEPLGLEGEEAM